MLLMWEDWGFEAGKRARAENSSTRVRTVSTEEPMVSEHCRITLSEAASGGVPRSRWRRMRSADKAIGVSGFLISCAMRRATSRQAVCFCARNRSVRSSNTTTYPMRWRWPSLEGDDGGQGAGPANDDLLQHAGIHTG